MRYDILTLKVIRGHWRSQKVNRRSNLKNAPRDPIFGIYAHVIPLTNIVYGILTSKVVRGYQSSLDVKMRSNLKNAPRDPILAFMLIIYPWPILSMEFWPQIIRGHQRLLEVKWRSKLKCSPSDSIFGMHSHMISLTNISYNSLTSKVIWGHQRLLEVRGGQNWKIHPGSPRLKCILLWYPWPI